MYHSVNTSELDQHTHRFLWQRHDYQQRGRYASISFGDKPARNIATLALFKTANLGKNGRKNASTAIKNNHEKHM